MSCQISLAISGLSLSEKNLIMSSFKFDSDSEWTSELLSTFCPEPDYNVTPVSLTSPDVRIKSAQSPEELIAALVNAPTVRDDSYIDWRLQNWGTRFEIYDISLELDNSTDDFYCSFFSEGVPIEALRTISSQFSNAVFVLEYHYSDGVHSGVTYFLDGQAYDLGYEVDSFKELWFEEFYPDLYARLQRDGAEDDEDLQDQLMDIWCDHEADALDWMSAPAHQCLHTFLFGSNPPNGPIEVKLGSLSFEIEPQPLPIPFNIPAVMSPAKAQMIAEDKFRVQKG